MTPIHTNRWQRPKADEDAPMGVPFGPYTGALNDLTLYEEPADDGLVDVHGQPIPRKPVAHRPLGFQPPGACGE